MSTRQDALTAAIYANNEDEEMTAKDVELAAAIMEMMLYGDMDDDFFAALARTQGITLEELKQNLERFKLNHRS
jgi:hypothetical protein